MSAYLTSMCVLVAHAKASSTERLRAFAGPCLAVIIDGENPGWNPRQWNTQGSGAYGLPQALPASKMRRAGRDWRTNPYTQIRWARMYARERYGSDCAALAHWRIGRAW